MRHSTGKDNYIKQSSSPDLQTIPEWETLFFLKFIKKDQYPKIFNYFVFSYAM